MAGILRGEEHAMTKGPLATLKDPREPPPPRYAGLFKSALCSVNTRQMRLTTQQIHAIADLVPARPKLSVWCRWGRWIADRYLQPIFASMAHTATMIERHFDGIMAHWIRPTTNAFIEGFNSVFSAVKRQACGFPSTDNLIAMPCLTASKPQITPIR